MPDGHPPTSLSLDIDGPVHVLDYGGDGSPVVLVHGGTSCAASWHALATRLADSHRVVAPDLLGHGETPLAGRRAGLAADRRVLDGVLDRLGLSDVTLVAFTRGGLVCASELARPGRCGRLVLLEPVVDRPGRLPDAGPLLLAALSASPPLADRVVRRLLHAKDGSDAAVERWLGISCAHPERVDAATRAALVGSMAVRLGEPRPFAGWANAFAEIGPMLLRRSLDRTYDTIDGPVLVVVGSDATSTSVAAVERLVRRHDAWTLEILDGVGHAALEAPGAVASRVERWLARTRTPGTA